MHTQGLRFSIAAHASWAPGMSGPEQWHAWARDPHPFGEGPDPALRSMPAMLRRRAGFLGKMALEVAYECLGERTGVPALFCSRHGEVSRAVDLIGDMAAGAAMSPTGFGLAVHNASAGLFSIARTDRANHAALAGGAASVEHGLIEACGLLADGASEVLLVAYDCPLPSPLESFEDCVEQPWAWAWLVSRAGDPRFSLALDAAPEAGAAATLPGGLDVLRFFLSGDASCTRITGTQRWTWQRHA